MKNALPILGFIVFMIVMYYVLVCVFERWHIWYHERHPEQEPFEPHPPSELDPLTAPDLEIDDPMYQGDTGVLADDQNGGGMPYQPSDYATGG